MDGVLFDSEPLHFTTLNDVLSQDRVKVTEAENLGLLGWPVEDVFRELIARRGLQRPLAGYMDLYDDAIVRIFRDKLVAGPGVSSLLHALRSRGLPLGLASSSKRRWIEAGLEATGLGQYFGAVVAGDEVTHGKPEPDIYLAVCEKLRIDPRGAVAVEDSPTGIEAAKRAGLRVIAVRTDYTRTMPLEQADRVVDSVELLGVEDFL
jgi:HAD superfamily hydrolase (TIGR01509 family)